MPATVCPYVSRGGLKLAAALDAFHLDVRGLTCADLGCSTGGFTDCLLQHQAAQVHAVDTAYGQFAYKLRQDPRVRLHERTNALYFDPRSAIPGFPGVDLVVIDLGWTRQALALPAALRWLKQAPAAGARIITLVKPHYEAPAAQTRGARRGILPDKEAQAILQTTLAQMPGLGVTVLDQIPSPIRGLSGKTAGNQEFLVLCQPTGSGTIGTPG